MDEVLWNKANYMDVERTNGLNSRTSSSCNSYRPAIISSDSLGRVLNINIFGTSTNRWFLDHPPGPNLPAWATVVNTNTARLRFGDRYYAHRHKFNCFGTISHNHPFFRGPSYRL